MYVYGMHISFKTNGILAYSQPQQGEWELDWGKVTQGQFPKSLSHFAFNYIF